MDASELNTSILVLKAHKDEWVRLPVSVKSRYLEHVLDGVLAVAPKMVRAAVAAKQIPVGPLEGEEWAGGPYCIARFCRLLIQTLGEIADYGSPQISQSQRRTRPDGQLAVEVFPAHPMDSLLFRGFRAEVWMRKEVTSENLQDNMACLYREINPLGRVSLVLGAGNVAAIGPMDVLTKLYVEGEVCLLKMSPVNGYLGPFIEEFFSEFVRDGFLRMAYGGADVGAYLCDHPDIDDIHITGSHVTHDAIMFGTGQEGISRKRSNTPRLRKRITSELGNVSPIIVVPGPWTASDLKFHAENIATQMINNAGFNCCAGKVLVLPQQWPSSSTLMEELQAVLAAAPQRKAYYPGAEERYDRFLSANKTARPVGPRHEGVLPWTLIPDLSPGDADSICFTTESFCGVMAQTALDEADVADYLRHAIEFCNHRLWGTLSACILIHPETERRLGAEFQKSIAGLHYGAIGINHWPMLAFALGSTTWGAFPDHTYQDIQSGIGIVHNARLFDKPERTVIYGPFRVWPKPVWFITNHESHNLMPKLVDLEGKPGLFKVLGVIPAALRG